MKVVALTEGVLISMLHNNLKLATTVLLMVAALGRSAVQICQTEAAEPPNAPRKTKKADREKKTIAKDERSPSDKERLQGKWKIISTIHDGKKEMRDDTDMETITVKGSTIKYIFTFQKDGETETKVFYFRFRLDETTNPKVVDLVEGEVEELFDPTEWDKRFEDADQRKEGIYSIEGDTWTVCMSRKIGERPLAIESKPGSDNSLSVLMRELPQEERKKDAEP